MIQRVQTIFLLLASLSSAAAFLFPFATATAPAEEGTTIFSDGIYNATDSINLMAIYGINAFLALAVLFMYKNRRIQSLLAMFGAGLSFAAASLTFLGLSKDTWAAANMQFVQNQYGLAIPVVAGVFYLISRFFIKKDDKLVASMDRLR